jgi:hypothetical protein
LTRAGWSGASGRATRPALVACRRMAVEMKAAARSRGWAAGAGDEGARGPCYRSPCG